MGNNQSDSNWERMVINRFIKQVKEIAIKLEDEGKNQEAVDLLFRLGVVCGLASKLLSQDQNGNP